jgi:hypothetical protein
MKVAYAWHGLSQDKRVRAASLVKCQDVVRRSALRCCTQAATSVSSVSWSGMRRARHWRASTESSNSARLSQLPWVGV